MNQKNKNQNANPEPSQKKWWRGNPLLNMTLHIVTTSMMFTIIAMAAYSLELLVDWLQERHASSFMVGVLHVFAYVLLVIDVVWAIASVLRGTIKEFFDD